MVFARFAQGASANEMAATRDYRVGDVRRTVRGTESARDLLRR